MSRSRKIRGKIQTSEGCASHQGSKNMARNEADRAPPGWHYDDDTGALMRDVSHRMGRRCRNWDYCGKGSCQITITLADRRSRALGRLCHDKTRERLSS